jgi:hypothetical protein
MNKLINNLKAQAGIADNPDQEGLDLFARLIVDECCQAVGSGHSWKTLTVEEIRRHFGIKQ